MVSGLGVLYSMAFVFPWSSLVFFEGMGKWLFGGGALFCVLGFCSTSALVFFSLSFFEMLVMTFFKLPFHELQYAFASSMRLEQRLR